MSKEKMVEKLMAALEKWPPEAVDKLLDRFIGELNQEEAALKASLSAEQIRNCRDMGVSPVTHAMALRQQADDERVVSRLEPAQRRILETMRGGTVRELAAAARSNGWGG